MTIGGMPRIILTMLRRRLDRGGRKDFDYQGHLKMKTESVKETGVAA